MLHGRPARSRKGPRAVYVQCERVGECQGGDSNSRPRAYESPALPLSYPGAKRKSSIPSYEVSTRAKLRICLLPFVIPSEARDLSQTRTSRELPCANHDRLRDPSAS